MPRIKALQILFTLTKDEFANFSRFVGSPFFNRSKDLVKLNDFLKPYYPDFQEDKISFEKIYKKIYPGKKFNEGTLRNLFSEFNNLAEQFLGYVNYKNSFEYNFNILREMNVRFLDKNFEKNYSNALLKNEKTPDMYGKKSLNKYFLKNEKMIFNRNRGNEHENKFLGSCFESLLVFVLKDFYEKQGAWSRIDYFFNLSGRANILEKFAELTDITGLINFIKENKGENFDEIELYHALYTAHINKDGNIEGNYQKAFDLFKAIEKKLTKEEVYYIYVWLGIIIEYNIQVEDKKLMYTLVNLRKEMADKFITSKMRGTIRAAEFKDILDTVLLVKDLNWAKKFLDTKIEFVDESIKIDFYHLYKARIFFYEQKFNESNEELAKVMSNNIMVKLDIKFLRLLNYYELGYNESAISAIEAFKQFLKRNDFVSNDIKTHNVKFAAIYIKLIRKKAGFDIDMDLLNKEIMEEPHPRFKVWLIKKCKELQM